MHKLDPSDSCSFKVETNYGSLHAHYDEAKANLNIEYYEVLRTQRRQGYGQQLLRLAFTEARGVSAQTISGVITSRESLTAATHVFGESAITIDAPGRFGHDLLPEHLRHGCRAILSYHLIPLQLTSLSVDRVVDQNVFLG